VGAPVGYVRSRLVGERIGAVGRRGKYLLVEMADGPTWVVHLRMTGSLLHRAAGVEDERYLRARATLDDGTELRFTDLRKFGTFQVVDDALEVVGKLGPEPLSDGFTVESLWASLRGRTGPLKSVLLNQEIVAGLGNIYVDEALFLARLHPRVPGGSLRPGERRALHASIQQVLREGIANRGTSFRDYTDADGKPGSQQHYVRVFRRTDQPCDVCGAVIRRSVVGGRSSHWCPRCQSARQASRQSRRGTRRRKGA
jgi:formamidopyrimidine-DNA glycosylase